MRAVVTGAAGFIGSHLVDRLLADGHEVAGVDCFTDYDPGELKDQNLAVAREHRSFRLLELDLAEDDLVGALDGADVVFHIAGRTGLESSRPNQFSDLVRDNVLATQRLLEALGSTTTSRLVFASSSSVYGDTERLPTKESSVPRPLSAYGVTKLAAENLVHVHSRQSGLPVTCLRYFTVYGPRQRPDMAIARFMNALIEDDEVEVFGDGEQTRDFTFVTDAVEATIRAAKVGVEGKVLNIGGGSRATLNAVLAAVEEMSGTRVRRRYLPPAAGDQRHTGASINLARQHLNWEPQVSLREGLNRQWAWFQELASRLHRGRPVAAGWRS